MSDPESDVFNLLKLNGLNLATHLITILKDLGYNDLRSLIELLEPEEIEAAVKESFSEEGVEDSYKELSTEQQKNAYGPKCFRNPRNFKLQPGEKASLAAISPLCRELLAKLPIVYPSPTLAPKSKIGNQLQPSLQLKMGKPSKVVDVTEAKTLPRKETKDKCGKPISCYINEWAKKKELEVDYGSDDYDVVSNKIQCLKCRKTYGFALNILGYWKAERFLAHVVASHPIKCPGIFFKFNCNDNSLNYINSNHEYVKVKLQ